MDHTLEGGTLVHGWYAATVVLALLAHQVFKRHETYSVIAHASLLLTPPLAVHYISQHCVKAAAASRSTDLLTCYVTFYVSLILSIVFYRLAPHHPLANTPGPLLYKISMLVWGYGTMDGNPHHRLKALHERYGDVVRIGPNDISICNPKAIPPVFGMPGIPKSPSFVGGTLGRCTDDIDIMMIGIMNIKEHLRRRRVWNRAFSTTAVKEYEMLVSGRLRTLIGLLGEQKDVVPLSKWLNYFAYDVMCDIAFGGGSELLKNGDKDNIWAVMEDGVGLGNFFGHAPWVGIYVGLIPGAAQSLNTLISYAHKLTAERLKRGSRTRDLFYHLTNEEQLDKPRPSRHQLLDDGLLAVVAGADTTSSALTSLFFCLATHADAYGALQKEVDQYYPNGEDPMNRANFCEMYYLNAVISETLRLFPPIPGGGQRKVPVDGDALVIGSIIIPPGTIITVPIYSLGRDSRNFSLPDTFWPERWLVASGHITLEAAVHTLRENNPLRTSSAAPPNASAGCTSSMVWEDCHMKFRHNEAAYIPFSYGPMNCAGKNLALLEMRVVVCALMQKFRFKLQNGWDSAEFEKGFKDYFVAARPDLPVVLEARC